MKKNLVLLLSVLLVLSWYVTLDSWLGNDEKYQEAIAQAQMCESKGLHLDAIEKYNTAMQYGGNNLEDHRKIALNYQMMGNAKDYSAQLLYIINTFGPDPETVKELFQYYMDNNREQKAIDFICTLREKNPDNLNIEELYESIKGSFTSLYRSFEYLSMFEEDYAVYMVDQKKGLIDNQGDVVIQADYDEIGFPYDDGQEIPVVQKGVAFYVNQKGYKTAEPEEDCEWLGMHTKSPVLARRNGKYGYLNSKTLKDKTEFEWEDASVIYQKTGVVKKDGKWALINHKCELITEYIYDDIVMNHVKIATNNEVIWVKLEGKYQLIDLEGNVISENGYDEVKPFEGENYCAVGKSGLWGFVDKQGELVIDFRYEDAKAFRAGAAPVMQSGLWGYIDENGVTMIENEFTDATTFNENGTAAVSHGDGWSLIQLKIYN